MEETMMVRVGGNNAGDQSRRALPSWEVHACATAQACLGSLPPRPQSQQSTNALYCKIGRHNLRQRSRLQNLCNLRRLLIF